MSSPSLCDGGAKGQMQFAEGSQETKPLTCPLCTFITESAEAFEQHQALHGNMRLYEELAPPVKQEPGGEWWPPYDGEEPSPLASDGSDGLGPRGGYGWDLQQDEGKPLDRQWGYPEGQSPGGDAKRNGQPKASAGFLSGGGLVGGEQPMLNFKVVVVGEEGGQGRRRRGGGCEGREPPPAEEELGSQRHDPFPGGLPGYEGEPEQEGEQAALSGESSPGSRPSASDPRASQSKQKWQSKQYQCDLSPYVARGKQDLRIHEREEHLKEGSDVIKCSQCNYTTNKISFWRQHKLVHISANGSTGRIYMCKTCGWKTKYRHSLVKHIALHTGNKSFQCDQCGFACARKENLKRHKLTHLKKGVDGKGLMLKCNWCEYATAHSNALRRHAMTLHNADENYVPEYRCDVCAFKTTKLSNFSNHKITHLYGEGYMMVHVNQTGPLKCSLCPFVTDHWDCLQEHQRTHKELRCLQDMLGSGSAGGEGEPALPPPDTEAEGGQGPQFSFGDPAPGEEEEEDEDEDEEAKGSSPGDFRVLDPRSAKVDNDILALGKIIGTIGEYVNGDDDPQRAVAESEIEYCGTSYRRAAVADRQREAGRDVAHALPDWDPHRQTQGLAANGHPPPGRKGAAAGWRKRRRPGAVGAGIVQQCPTCGWEGTSRQSLAQHIARHGLTKRFRCSQCRFACYKKDRLRRHLLTHGARPPDHPGPEDSEAVGIPGTGAEAAREGNVPLTPGASSPRLAEPHQISLPASQFTCGVPEPVREPTESPLSLERERLELEKERLEFEREKWKAQQGLLALQQRKLQLQLLLLEKQLDLIKTQPQT